MMFLSMAIVSGADPFGIRRESSLFFSAFRVPRGGITVRSDRRSLSSFEAPVGNSFVPPGLGFVRLAGRRVRSGTVFVDLGS